MDVQRQTYAQTVEYDVCRSYIIAASFQLFNAMVLALDQCANFNSALCLWSFHGVVRDFENRWGRFLKAVPAVWLSANHYLEQAPLSPARQEDRVPLSSGPMTGAQQWEKKSAQNRQLRNYLAILSNVRSGPLPDITTSPCDVRCAPTDMIDGPGMAASVLTLSPCTLPARASTDGGAVRPSAAATASQWADNARSRRAVYPTPYGPPGAPID